MTNGISFVGLDSHAESLNVALLVPGESRPLEWQCKATTVAVRNLATKLRARGTEELLACYEAGPTGFQLQRLLAAQGIDCVVVAPSMIPIKPGDRIKTDRRDARKLAELLRANLLTPVRPPSPAEEAARSLVRCRSHAIRDLMAARHRLSKMLLRLGHRWHRLSSTWGKSHRKWLHSLSFEQTADLVVFQTYLLSIEQIEARIEGLDAEIAQVAASEPYREGVGWLRCFRGIDTLIALTIITELHGFERFRTPRHLMSYLGLVPSEHSSGSRTHRGAITKAGNSHVRRALIQSAKHASRRPRVSRALNKRREGQPAEIIAIADKAQQRLYRRYHYLKSRGKHANTASAAIARELVGFIWSALRDRTD